MVSITGSVNPKLTLDDLELSGLDDLDRRLKKIAADAEDDDADLILLIQADRRTLNGVVFDVKVTGLKKQLQDRRGCAV